jgi:hypothetical protein
MKSVYIAARAKYRSEEVAEVQGKVKKLGYKIASRIQKSEKLTS